MENSTPWHSLALGEVLARVSSKKDGLSSVEAKKRLERDGSNALTAQEDEAWWMLLLRQFVHPLLALLIAAGVATLFMGHWHDAIVIFIVVALQAGVGFYQERKAKKALDSLHKQERQFAWVLRDGRWQRIRVRDVVPGDRILLRAGDKVPADARLAAANHLEVSEAILTGESEPMHKQIEPLPEETELQDRINMVWRGTTVVSGRGEAIVTATGDKTEFGRIGTLTARTRETRTPFERRVDRLGRFLGIVTVVIVLVLFGLGVAAGRPLTEMFMVAVAVTVSALPEGLPIALTAILAIGMVRILHKEGLVKTLSAAQALGSTSVILTDKTGTLTEGRMRVGSVLAAHKKGGVLDFGEVGEGDERRRRGLQIGALTSDVIIENPHEEPENQKLRGNGTDQALVLAAMDGGMHPDDLDATFAPVVDIPFRSERKFAATVREVDGEYHLFVTGAPDVLLSKVSSVVFSKKTAPLSSDDRNEVRSRVSSLANEGMRVLCTATRKLENGEDVSGDIDDSDINALVRDLTLVSLVAIVDPVRSDVPQTVAEVTGAGVRTVIVTGDHALTASRVGKEIGLLGEERTLFTVMEGAEVGAMDDEELARRVRNVDVFARVTPEHKLRITRAWQKHGDVVATFGDGVNDAPALKHADVGVAVGSGTDLAREAADIVLLNNSFSTIVDAVREGRVIIDNLKKVITYMLSDSFTEVVLLSVAILAGLPLPILPAQILWAKVVADSGPSIALAFEPAEKDVMKLPPVRQDRSIIDKEMRFLIIVVGLLTDVILLGLFFFFLAADMDIERIRTIIFAALSIETLLYAFSMRSLRRPLWQTGPFENKYLLGAVGVGALLTLLAVYVPPFSTLVRTVPLTGLEWIIIVGFGMVNLAAIELGKFLYYRKKSLNHQNTRT